MRSVEIRCGIRCSALGFGCAPIMGSIDAQKARMALGAALDAGITHFDLARSYGYGQAEKFVGRFLRSRRNQVTITTKFGIRATPIARAIAPLKPLVRRLRPPKNAGPAKLDERSSAPRAKRLADFLHERIDLTPETMRKSLNKSLRELGTEYVDFFLIHEPAHEIDRIDDLIGQAEALRAEGKIRAFGLAYMLDQAPLHLSYLSEIPIHQFDSPCRLIESSGEPADYRSQPNFLFSPFRRKAADESSVEVLQALNSEFPTSVILCSMFSPAHIRDNAAVFSA